MNWYKRASQNVQLDPLLESEAKRIAAEVIKKWDIFTFSKNTHLPYDLKYNSKYTKEEENVIVLFCKSGINKNTIATYDEISKVIKIYPDNLVQGGVINSLNSPIAVRILSSYIIHEIIHNVDPRSRMSNYRDTQVNIKKEVDKGNRGAYYRSFSEVDGYSKQISYDIKMKINDQQYKSRVSEWLKHGDFEGLLSLVNPVAFEPFLRALESSPDRNNYLKMLKQRIYNEINV